MGEWSCVRCGRCCTEFVMYSATPDAKKFWGLRGFPTRELPDGTVEARLTAFCEWLTLEDGIATCTHYDQRPGTCVRYSCEGKP